MKLITPSIEISESYFEALDKGYGDKSRGTITTDKDITIIKNDFSAFVRTFDDLEASADLIALPKESLQNPVVQDRGMIKSRHETDYLCR